MSGIVVGGVVIPGLMFSALSWGETAGDAVTIWHVSASESREVDEIVLGEVPPGFTERVGGLGRTARADDPVPSDLLAARRR
ncbi:MAG: hypothetical protein WKF43_04575 [Acidimicrobiales bacterium]